MASFLTVARDNKTQHITLWLVMKNDIMPWFASAGLALLLFAGVSALVGSIRPDMDSADATASLYIWARPFYFALIVLACFLARRSLDMRTWILSAILIIFFIPQTTINLAVAILPNSILQALIAMIGFLALERIIEYIRMRHIIKLEDPTVSTGALIGYGLLICGAIVFDAPQLYNIFWA